MFSMSPRNISVPSFFSKLCLSRSLRARNGSRFNSSKSFETLCVWPKQFFTKCAAVLCILKVKTRWNLDDRIVLEIKVRNVDENGSWLFVVPHRITTTYLKHLKLLGQGYVVVLPNSSNNPLIDALVRPFHYHFYLGKVIIQQSCNKIT
jgi:hypothetical protein